MKQHRCARIECYDLALITGQPHGFTRKQPCSRSDIENSHTGLQPGPVQGPSAVPRSQPQRRYSLDPVVVAGRRVEQVSYELLAFALISVIVEQNGDRRID